MTVTDAELDWVIAAREEELRKLKRRRRAIRSGKAGGRPKKDPERDAQILAAYRNWEGPTRYRAIRAIAERFHTYEWHISRVTQSLRQGGEA